MDYLAQVAAETTTTAATTAEETTTTTTTVATTEAPVSSTEETTTTPATTQETVVTTVANNTVGVADSNYMTLCGDVNCDGEVTILDAVLLQKYMDGLVTLNITQMANGDCVRDGNLESDDVTVILQYLIEKYDTIPVV